MSSPGRPRVFVSSTVHDFGDLRSALKFWLEQLGYDAQLSEFNDFDKPLDTDSYSACLSAIDNTDYFMLLIGTRVGGPSTVDGEQISITRQEYRRAFKRFRETGKPHIVAFVRKSVWELKEDRDALARFLRDDQAMKDELSPEAASKIIHHAGYRERALTDAAAIFSFIDEVRRVDEARAAKALGPALPSGNWVHQFNTFAEIVDVMRTQIRAGSVRRATVVAGLRAELVTNARALMMSEQNPTPVKRMVDWLIADFYKGLPTDADVDHFAVLENHKLTFDDQHRKLLLGFSAVGKSVRNMITRALDDAIRSGEFLEWDSGQHRFTATLLFHALIRLDEEIKVLAANERGFDSPRLQPVLNALANAQSQRGSVNLTTATTFVAVHHRHENILTLIAAILEALDGNEKPLLDARLWSLGNVLSEVRETIRANTGSNAGIAMWLSDLAAKGGFNAP